MTSNSLGPWPVIVACLFELDSHVIPQIIDKSGMSVDWSLTEREDYSHNYRKRAYRPRIGCAYQRLDSDNQLRVAFIVANELALQGRAEQLDASLQDIGWGIDAGKLAPMDESVRELFFPRNVEHDAYVSIRKIIRRAKDSICIVDPYLDETIFKLFAKTGAALKIRLLTDRLPKDFTHETGKFQRQYPHLRIEIRRSRDFHDRFIVIDRTYCWHVGCSIKDAGDRAFMLNRIEDDRNAKALLDSLDATWASASQRT